VRICGVCFHAMEPNGAPLPRGQQPPLPSRSRGDASSFVWFGIDVCLRCRLLRGEVIEYRERVTSLSRDDELVIEYREGFAFVSRDRKLYTVGMHRGRWLVAVVPERPNDGGSSATTAGMREGNA